MCIRDRVDSYDRYARYNGIVWRKPLFKRSSQPPYVPTTEEITILTSDAGKKYSLILSILRDTGMRPIELERAKLKWFDLSRGVVNVQTAKYGAARTLKLKNQNLSVPFCSSSDDSNVFSFKIEVQNQRYLFPLSSVSTI